MNYVVKFEYGDDSIDGMIKRAMQLELIDTYNMFCREANVEYIEQLNRSFHEKYPDYKIADDLWSSVEYVDYFREAYSKITDRFNEMKLSQLLEYYIGDELELIGRSRFNSKNTISFYLVPEGS